MKFDTFGTSADAGLELMREMQLLQDSNSRLLLPQNNLAIDPTRAKPFGKRILDVTSRQNSMNINLQGESEEILEQLEDISSETTELMAEVGIVLLSYVLHDFSEDDSEHLFESIRAMCPEAAIVIADYTMKELPPEQALLLFTANIERENIRKKSTQLYLEEHMKFAYEDICALLGKYFPNLRGLSLQAGRAVFIGSDIELANDTTLQAWRDESFTQVRPQKNTIRMMAEPAFS